MQGDVIGFSTKCLKDGTNTATEMEVALLAILLCKKLNVKSLHLEGDSKVIIDGMMRGTM